MANALQVEHLIAGVLNSSGTVNDAGKAFFFSTGTTDNKTIYADALKVANYSTTTQVGTPHDGKEYVLLDSYGIPGNGEVYADGAYDIYIYDSLDVLIKTLTNVNYTVLGSDIDSVTTITAATYTIQDTDTVILCDTSSNSIILTIGSDSSAIPGKQFYIIKITSDANTVTVNPQSGDTFEDLSSLTISKYFQSFTIEADGNNLFLNRGKSHPNFAPYELGYVQRGGFSKNTNAINMIASVYHHSGTKDQMVQWDSAFVFTLGSGGSNTSSADLGASEWHFIYIDDSAVVTADTHILTASEFINNTNVPTWSNTKHGYYNGSDRLIFAILTDGASDMLEFYQDGDYIAYADEIEDLAVVDIANSWTALALTAPQFCTKVEIVVDYRYSNGAATAYWRTTGQTGTTGHTIAYVEADSHISVNTLTVTTNASQSIDRQDDAVVTNTLRVTTQGWYLPRGM